MDLLTRADLERLVSPDYHGRHVSIFLPTHRFGSGVEADQIRWKNALSALEPVLAELGMGGPEVEDLIAPGWDLHRDSGAWQQMSDGLVMFLRPGWQRTFRVPTDVPELTAVGDRFVIGPLLPLFSGDQHFLVLAVSQRQVRLLEGTRHTVEEIVLPEVPISLRDVIEPPERRSDTMARPVSPAGSGGPAVFYGHGATDDHWKKGQIEHFLRRVADGLDTYLATVKLPMVLMGLNQLVSMYRDVTNYRYVLDADVRRNPDPLTPEQLHAAAWPLVARQLAADKQRVVERFEELHGTGRASTDPAKLQDAAAHGRVEVLLLAANPTCWEHATARPPRVVQIGADEAFAPCELLDRISIDTLVRNGAIYTFSDTPVPGGGDVAAVLRY